MEVTCACVVAETPNCDAREHDDPGRCNRAEHKPLLAEDVAQPAFAQADGDRRGGEAQGHDAELEARKRGERCKEQEEHLRPASRFGERAHTGGDRCECEWIRDRFGEHKSRIQPVGHEERARCDGKRELLAGSDTPCEQVRGQCGQRERR